MDVDATSVDLGKSGWNAILPPRVVQDPLDQDIACDYLIVGAGFAGLSAAQRLRQLEPKAEIVLVEGGDVAEGPAGRNSGFMIDMPHALTSGRYQGENSKDSRNIRMNRSAIAFVESIASQYQFDSDVFNRCGKINAAASRTGLRSNQIYARHLERLKEPFEWLGAEAIGAICGSQYYLGGLRTPGTAVIQPALYVRSLVDALRRQANCRIFERSAVQSLNRIGDCWRACTAQGSVRANRVILAVNGLIESFGFYRHRLMHINLYASMTRALSSSEVDLLGGEKRWGFTPSDPIGSTLRRIDGHGEARLMIRNQCHYKSNMRLSPRCLSTVAGAHQRTFLARFPMLESVSMEYCWSGRLCLSRNDVWALAELAPGLFSACCQNGLGTTRGTIAGIVAAEMASEHKGESLVPDYQREELPRRLLPEPFMTIGARALIRFKQWRAGKEL